MPGKRKEYNRNVPGFIEFIAMDDGYIKYSCQWDKKPVHIPAELLNELNKWRGKFYGLNLIGMYGNGIGYGNISICAKPNSFYITGSATGAKAVLRMADYAEVTHWNIKQNRLSCRGNTKASSESLSHAAIYEVDSRIKAVIHIHSARLWNKLRNVLPTTPDIAAYGTPEMAESIKLLVQDKPYQTNGIIIMGGHEEGILCYGADLKEAGELLLSYATNF